MLEALDVRAQLLIHVPQAAKRHSYQNTAPPGCKETQLSEHSSLLMLSRRHSYQNTAPYTGCKVTQLSEHSSSRLQRDTVIRTQLLTHVIQETQLSEHSSLYRLQRDTVIRTQLLIHVPQAAERHSYQNTAPYS